MDCQRGKGNDAGKEMKMEVCKRSGRIGGNEEGNEEERRLKIEIKEEELS